MLRKLMVGMLCLTVGSTAFAQSTPTQAAPIDSLQNRIYDLKGSGGYSITAFDRKGDVPAGFAGLMLGGYFDTEFMFADGSDQSLDFDNHHLILEVSARPHERVLFNAEIEYEHGGKEISIEQAWVDLTFSEGLINRVGVIVLPFGLVNLLHDSDIRETTNRGDYATYIVPTTWTDTGVGAYGSLDLGDIEFNYSGYVINGLDAEITGSRGIRDARQAGSGSSDNNDQKAFVGRLGFSPELGINIGSSFYSGAYDRFAENSLTMWGVDALISSGPVTLLGEYANTSIEVSAADSAVIPERMQGYYLEGRYTVPSDFFGLLSDFDESKVTLFSRVGVIDTDVSNSSSGAKRHNRQITTGFNIRPVQNLVYKLEYEMNDELSGSSIDNNRVIASVAMGF